jgi:hypothetical protein
VTRARLYLPVTALALALLTGGCAGGIPSGPRPSATLRLTLYRAHDVNSAQKAWFLIVHKPKSVNLESVDLRDTGEIGMDSNIGLHSRFSDPDDAAGCAKELVRTQRKTFAPAGSITSCKWPSGNSFLVEFTPRMCCPRPHTIDVRGFESGQQVAVGTVGF